MKYVIYGAGKTGITALRFLGPARVSYFVDNDPAKKTKKLYDKEMIDFPTFLRIKKDDIIVVIATEKYWEELEEQIIDSHIERYFVFHEVDQWKSRNILPCYALNKYLQSVSYNRILSYNKIAKYKRISILGTNEFLPYLIAEISYQSKFENIVQIIREPGDIKENCLGIPCVSWEEADKMIDCLVINKKRCQVVNADVYENEANVFDIVDLYDVDYVEPSFEHPELKKYKNMHRGKRIFVIGNGPSLTFKDLETLHRNHEICIAFNNMYMAYDRTDFRADFYGMWDQYAIEGQAKDLKQIPGCVFIGDGYHRERPEVAIKGVQYYHDIKEDFFPNPPKFSDDFCKGFYRAGTVSYFGLQLAAYLGAKEIYLLGIDHDYSQDENEKGNHFIKESIISEDLQKLAVFEFDNATRGYEFAEEYSRRHNFRIYNATRGGKLEVFERVDFDSLF